MKFLRSVHTTYGLLVFVFFFLLFFPILLVPIFWPQQFRVTGVVNRWWAKLTLAFCGLPYQVVLNAPLDRNRQYIFCPNHFSYLDIPTMGLNPVNTVFVGKTLGFVPLFSFMYDRLHILVDRTRLRSRSDSLRRSLQAVDEGKSLVIFAEGGMITHHPPQMAPFKDGAFRVAIEKQIPLVPVTIPFNWIILPDNDHRLRWGKVKVVFHEPISTAGMTLADADHLKARVYRIIDNELKRHVS